MFQLLFRQDLASLSINECLEPVIVVLDLNNMSQSDFTVVFREEFESGREVIVLRTEFGLCGSNSLLNGEFGDS